MKIAFTLTKKAIWRHLYRRWLPGSIRLMLRLCALTIFCSVATSYGMHSLLLAEIVAIVVGIVPFAAFLLMLIDLLRRILAVKDSATGQRVAELGKFDLRYGAPESPGFYYHWADLEKIREDREHLSFVLPRSRVLLVPKSAFEIGVGFTAIPGYGNGEMGDSES